MEIFAFKVGGGLNGSQQYLIGIHSIVYNYNLPILFRSGFQFDVTVQCTYNGGYTYQRNDVQPSDKLI